MVFEAERAPRLRGMLSLDGAAYTQFGDGMKIVTEGEANIVAIYLLICKERGDTPDKKKLEGMGREVGMKKVVLQNGLVYLQPLGDGGKPYIPGSCTACSKSHTEEARLGFGNNIVGDGLDLGDGLGFQHFGISGKGRRRIGSLIEKNFKSDDTEVDVDYLLVPPEDGYGGFLDFTYSYKIMKNSRPGILGKAEILPGVSMVLVNPGGRAPRYVVDVNVKTADSEKGSDCETEVFVAHIDGPQNAEVMKFFFDPNGKMRKVESLSKGEIGGGFSGRRVAEVVKRGEGSPLEYSAATEEAGVLSEAVFGKDVTGMVHYTAETLKVLVRSARTEDKTDPLRQMVFSEA